MSNKDYNTGLIVGLMAKGTVDAGIPDGAVTTPKIADGAVTLAKLASDVVSIVDYDYMKMNGTAGITLPFKIDADYEVECTFYNTAIDNNVSIIGNTIQSSSTAPNYLNFTPFNNAWYCSIGNGQGHFGSWSTGEHTVIINKNQGVYFDDVYELAYTPTTYNANITIGSRYSLSYFKNYIKTFKIRSISTGDLLFDLKFKKVTLFGSWVLMIVYDAVSGDQITTTAVDYFTDTPT